MSKKLNENDLNLKYIGFFETNFDCIWKSRQNNINTILFMPIANQNKKITGSAKNYKFIHKLHT